MLVFIHTDHRVQKWAISWLLPISQRHLQGENNRLGTESIRILYEPGEICSEPGEPLLSIKIKNNISAMCDLNPYNSRVYHEYMILELMN